MEISLERNLASVVRFIQDNAADGTQLYFDEIPAQFAVPSIYFQVPATSAGKATLSSYRTTVTMNCWFMEGADWDAELKASDMRDSIMLNNCYIPMVDEDGAATGKSMRVSAPATRKVDEGIVQLALSFDVYFALQGNAEKMQNFYVAWRNAVQKVKGGNGK